MREMKHTHYKWLGDIPSNWKVERNKYLADISIGLVTTMTENYVDDLENGVYLIRNGNIRTNEIISDNMVYLSKDFAKLNEHRKLHKGNIVTVHTGDVGTSAIIDDQYDGCMGFATIQTIPYPQKAYNKYLCWFYNSEAFKTQSIEFSTGDGRQNLNLYDFVDFFVPIPPIKEQKLIAEFLDKKCSEIDALTKDIEKQIEVLEDYKKSVITEAVTRGLNPNVEMKESEIQWIGDYPKNWNLIRLKFAALLKGRIGWQGLRTEEYLDDENLPYLITGTDFDNGFINWKTCAHVSEERFRIDSSIQIKENDLLITKDGTIGKLAVAVKCPDKVCLNSGVFLIRNTKSYKYEKKYLYYILQSTQFTKWYELSNAGNSTIKHLNQEKFYNFQFTFPNIQEQKNIADYLDNKCKEIDNTILDKQKQLEILDNYKKSLIYEYVTGKKEVIVE